MDGGEKLRYQQAKQLYETALSEKVAPNSVDLERKAELITEALNKGQTLTITYKGFERDIYPYASDGKYCIAYCTINQELRTFRIDRMEKVRATGIFTQNQSLLAEARSRLMHAPKYQYHRTYRW